VIGSSLVISPTEVDGVDEDDEDDEDGPTRHARMYCQLKPASEQR
jgi:hypothetical protein